MNDLLPYIVVGLTSGSVYGLAGVGLVLTFRTTGVFNFAHGAVGAAGAYAFYDLHVSNGLPWPIAAAVCVLVLGPVVGFVLERIAGTLTDGLPVMAIVVTVGLFVFIQGFLSWHYSPLLLPFPKFLPTGHAVTVAGVAVAWDQVITMGTGAAATIGLSAFLRRTRMGLAMRGVVDDAALVSLSGTTPRRVMTAAWMIGSSFALLSGLLIGPTFGRDPVLLTLLVVQAFGAAAIGRFSSLPLTYVGGLVVGVIAALATKFVSGHPALGGLPIATPFFVLCAVLLATPSRRLGGIANVPARFAQVRQRGSAVLQRAALVMVAIALLAVPHVVGTKLSVYISGLTYFIVFLSLALLVWTSGQISLCHVAFVALGATTFSHLTAGRGLPWALALVLTGIATVPAGALVALPAIRVRGVYLALATLGFGLLMERVAYGTPMMFGRAGFRGAPRPELAFIDGRSNVDFYYVVLLIAALAAATAVVVVRSQMGRFLRGLADAPVALTVHGLGTNVTRLLIVCVSAYIAGIAGALFISASGQVSGDSFSALTSLLWLAVLAIAGTSMLRGPFMAAILLAVVPAYLSRDFTAMQEMVFGAVAVLIASTHGRTILHVGERTRDRLSVGPVRSRVADLRSSMSPQRFGAETPTGATFHAASGGSR